MKNPLDGVLADISHAKKLLETVIQILQCIIKPYIVLIEVLVTLQRIGLPEKKNVSNINGVASHGG